MLRSYLLAFRFITLALIQLLLIHPGNAQQLADVPWAFKAINDKPQVLHLKKNAFKIPAGGHLQGIQCLGGNNIVITASSDSYSYYLTGQLSDETGKGEITSLHKIADSPYRHAGGCQVSGNKLVVGIEDNQEKDKSQIVMISFDESTKQNGRRVIARRQGSVKRSTAGAVGFTKTFTGQCLIAAGDWDSRNIDFYISRKGNDTLLDSITTFHVPDYAKWPSYQALNLLIDSAGNIYLIGFALDGFNNLADLFRVEFKDEKTNLVLCNTRNFKCRGGAGFRYGSGIYVTPDGRLTIYSCGRNATQRTPINIFR
jgi:hypothetical protein